MREDTVVLTIAPGKTGDVVLSIAPQPASLPTSLGESPERFERRWHFVQALLAPPPPATPPPLPPPPADDTSLLISTRAALSMRITKAAEDRLEIELPSGSAHTIAGPSIDDVEARPLGQYLMTMKMDLLHRLGPKLSAHPMIAATVREISECLLLEPGGPVPWLRVSLVDPLGTQRPPEPPPDAAAASAGPAQPTLDFAGFAARLANAPPRSVIVMVGAGMSVAAGIPDFRTPGSGLYDNLQAYGLPYPEAIFDVSYFPNHPAPFYRLCAELWPGQYQPTAAHRFVKALHDRGLLLRCFTQNIDSLETAAGLPPEKLVAAHGNFDSVRELSCSLTSETTLLSPVSVTPAPTGSCRGRSVPRSN